VTDTTTDDEALGHRSDPYFDHLLQLSTGSNTVVALEDIYNQFGVLLIKEGTPLSTNSAARLKNHTLEKQVDEVLSVSNKLNTANVLHRINTVIQSHPDLELIHIQNNFDDQLRHLCLSKDIPPILLQKLTVLEQSLPKVFQRSLFCAWLGAMVANRRSLSGEDIYLTFLAGLFHDFGLLHIDPEIVVKPGDYTPEEWRAIQSHVVLGKNIIENINHYPSTLALAISDHHERSDGTGYPRAKEAESLNVISQIIAMIDMLYDLRFKNLLIKSSNLGNCLPYLRVNTKTFTEPNYSAMSKILRISGLDAFTDAQQDPGELATEVNEAANSVVALLEQLAPLRDKLDDSSGIKQLMSTAKLLNQIDTVILSAGINHADLSTWLQSISGDAADHAKELNDLHITLHEILWLSKRITRNLFDLGENSEQPDTEMEKINAGLQQVLDKAWAIYGS
jgi:HD-GYP domain-containing protein (c-di-GMP phosphodiesterase class II)